MVEKASKQIMAKVANNIRGGMEVTKGKSTFTISDELVLTAEEKALAEQAAANDAKIKENSQIASGPHSDDIAYSGALNITPERQEVLKNVLKDLDDGIVLVPLEEDYGR